MPVTNIRDEENKRRDLTTSAALCAERKSTRDMLNFGDVWFGRRFVFAMHDEHLLFVQRPSCSECKRRCYCSLLRRAACTISTHYQSAKCLAQ